MSEYCGFVLDDEALRVERRLQSKLTKDLTAKGLCMRALGDKLQVCRPATKEEIEEFHKHWATEFITSSSSTTSHA